MDTVDWVLINAGDALLWLGGALKGLFLALGGALDTVLNPVLSPVLAFLNPAFTAVGDAVYAGLSRLPAWAGLALLSAVCGVIMLAVYRYTSNQAAIGRARDAMSANLLALKLFKDDLGVAFRCQGRLFAALLRWQWHMLRPMSLLVVLLLPVFAQMGTRYQWRPLRPGEQSLVRVNLRNAGPDVSAATLAPCPGVADAVGPVPGGGQLVWRIHAGEPGRYVLRFEVAGETIEKELVIGPPFRRVSAERPDRCWTAQLLHPVERPLPARGPVRSIEIAYGGVESHICGANWWILTFFVVSLIAALVLLPVFRVRF